jgi:hypothetical protein
VQHEEHDARSISIEIVSAMPVDDKLVVLVGDKPVEFKPLSDERKDIAACSTVCIDNGVQMMLLVLIMCQCKWRRG